MTQRRRKLSEGEREENRRKIAEAVKTILECIGEDPERDGLKRTPVRYADALLYCTAGYEADLQRVCNGALFEENHDEMVLVRDIQLHSLCEHHMLPFWGRIHIAYIPNRRVLGLSKLARIAEMYARRLQVQERLTKQIASAVQEILQPQGVAVVVEAEHMCMAARGVCRPGSLTITSAMLGAFRGNAKTREEFLSLIRTKH